MDARGGYLVSTAPQAAPRYHLFAPEGAEADPPVVLVHGAASDPSEHFRSFLGVAAARQRVLIVPEFLPPAFRGYQRLAGRAGALAAAVALDTVLADAARILGTPIPRVDLVGFSGGAQFAHRYAMLFPGRVRRLVVAAAGWYTRLDPDRPFAEGPLPSRVSGHRAVEIDAFLRLPILIAVGERDVARGERFRVDPRIDAEQGAHRLERALRWAEHLRSAAASRNIPADVTLELLPGTGHRFRHAVRRGRLGERVLDFLASNRVPPAAPAGETGVPLTGAPR